MKEKEQFEWTMPIDGSRGAGGYTKEGLGGEELTVLKIDDLKRGDGFFAESFSEDGKTKTTYEVTIVGKRKDGLRVFVTENISGPERSEIQAYEARMPFALVVGKGETKVADLKKEKLCLAFVSKKDLNTGDRLSGLYATPTGVINKIRLYKKSKEK